MGDVIQLRAVNVESYGAVHARIEAGEYPSNSYAKFKEELAENYGVTGNPKANLLFIIAFHKGAHEGLPGILKVYDELVCLIR